MAVVTALELDDLVATRVAAGQPNRAHGRFGTGADHAQPLHRRHQFADLLGNPRFERTGRSEAESMFGGLLHGVDDGRVRVAEDHRTPGPDIVDEAAAILGLDPGAGGALEEDRFAADAGECANRRIHAARNDVLRVAKQTHQLPRSVRVRNGRQCTG